MGRNLTVYTILRSHELQELRSRKLYNQHAIIISLHYLWDPFPESLILISIVSTQRPSKILDRLVVL